MRRRRCVPGLWWATALLLFAAVVPVAAAPPLQGEVPVHVVQPGETLSVIAQRYGVTVAAIVSSNNLADPDRLSVGQELSIPGVSPDVSGTAVYVVQAGDTLALICRRRQVDLDRVAQLNRLANPNLIHVGQRLLVPIADGGDAPPTAGQVHVVQAGETMARIAARYGVAVWAIAQANDIVNPNVLQAGQRLLVPTGAGQSSLPAPFVSVTVVPSVAMQGQTVQVRVETDGEVALAAQYDGQPLLLVGKAGSYRTLFGIHPMAETGPYALDIEAVVDGHKVPVHSMVQVVEGDFGVQYLALSAEKAALLEPTLVAEEAARLWEVTTQVTLPGQWQGAFQVPLLGAPAVSAPFGIRRSYDGGPPISFHSGVDYVAPEGAPVRFPAAGRVVLAEELSVRGKAVIVDHGRGVMSGYWHLSRIDVEVGQVVDAGEQLGLVGNTGLSTGAHLHWEVRVHGVQVDPLQWASESIQ